MLFVQRRVLSRAVRLAVTALVALTVAACSDSGGGGGTIEQANFPAPQEASKFLAAATFGPTQDEVDRLVNIGYSAWFRRELDRSIRRIVPRLPSDADYDDTQIYWWRNAVFGDDQLRQRMAFALSQIMVISANDLGNRGYAMGRYMDILQENAFGNFGELLSDVTYSPAMGTYLTYIGNQKANPNNGSVPDENYAREVMQLFTIGLVELNRDGTERTNAQGEPIESYDNTDITELAKVFTGLWWGDLEFRRNRGDVDDAIEVLPMDMSDEDHSPEPKTFLGLAIPAGTPGDESIRLALEHLTNHANTGPFIGRQLIQRFVTSNPSPAYIERVALAFEVGVAELPDGTMVGQGRRGDLTATLAAVLFDPEALNSSAQTNPAFGKLREPVVMFAHWARAFDVNAANPDPWFTTRTLNRPDRLNQQPFRSPSVFNFYRPGYVAAGTITAGQGLVAPELQIVDANSIVGFANFMASVVQRTDSNTGDQNTFIPDYSDELALLETPDAVLDRLNIELMGGAMRPETRARIVAAIDSISDNNEEREALRKVQAAVLIGVTSPEFMAQF